MQMRPPDHTSPSAVMLLGGCTAVLVVLALGVTRATEG